jgi:hypothetical protein
MTTVRATKGYARRLVLGALLAAAAGGALGGCASMRQGPTYTEAELKAICERRGGWWRGTLIPGYCEYQTAFSQSP